VASTLHKVYETAPADNAMRASSHTAFTPKYVCRGFAMMQTILVIDPDATHRNHFRRTLADMDMAVDFFDTTESLPPDFNIAAYPIVIVDLELTKLSKALCDAWRRSNRHIQLIGLSQRTFHPGLEEIIDHYLFACIKKPVDADELAFVLKSVSRLKWETSPP
jgi:DNA-binding NtrC family response regulator